MDFVYLSYFRISDIYNRTFLCLVLGTRGVCLVPFDTLLMLYLRHPLFGLDLCVSDVKPYCNVSTLAGLGRYNLWY